MIWVKMDQRNEFNKMGLISIVSNKPESALEVKEPLTIVRTETGKKQIDKNQPAHLK